MPADSNNLKNMTFLRCQSGNSDKFYVVIDLPQGTYLLGYGKSSTIGLSWSLTDRDAALKKIREKMSPRKGYEHDTPLPPEIAGIAANVRNHLHPPKDGETVSLNVSERGIEYDIKGGEASAPAPAPKPKGPVKHPAWAEDW